MGRMTVRFGDTIKANAGAAVVNMDRSVSPTGAVLLLQGAVAFFAPEKLLV
jgi:hypothetical protein